MESQTLTHVKLSPAHLSLALGSEKRTGRDKTLIVGGEQLGTALAKRTHLQWGDHWSIFNEYGPTEATIGCVAFRVDPGSESDAPAVPIGFAIANVEARVLDDQRKPVAAGDAGELYLSGACLAIGYGGDPTATARSFVTLASGLRAYWTGDMVCMDEQGRLVFQGRQDSQVNLHGHRVELGEIENAMLELTGVEAAAVVCRDNRAGRPDLVGFYSSEAGLNPNRIEQHLQDRLPAYMRLSRLQRLQEMPLSSNGKVDKTALEPVEDRGNAASTPEQEASWTTTELALLRIWRTALGFEESEAIGLEEDFYDLGGDSLALLEILKGTVEQILGISAETAFMARIGEMAQALSLRSMAAMVEQLDRR